MIAYELIWLINRKDAKPAKGETKKVIENEEEVQEVEEVEEVEQVEQENHDQEGVRNRFWKFRKIMLKGKGRRMKIKIMNNKNRGTRKLYHKYLF